MNKKGKNNTMGIFFRIIIATYGAVVAVLFFGVLQWGLNLTTFGEDGKPIDVKNWVSMVVTLIVPLGIAIMIWKYSDIKQGQINAIIKEQDDIAKEKERITLQKISQNLLQAIFLLEGYEELTKKLTDDVTKDIPLQENMTQNTKAAMVRFQNITEDDLEKIRNIKLALDIKEVVVRGLWYCQGNFGKSFPPSKDGILTLCKNTLEKITEKTNVETK